MLNLKSTVITGLFLLSLASCKNSIQKYSYEVQGKNITSKYNEVWDLNDNQKNHAFFIQYLSNFENIKVLLVPGFLSEVYIGAGAIPGVKVTRLGEYFDEQIKWLEEMGIDHQRIDLESEETPEHNAEAIKEAFQGLKENQKVILLSHSKGGLDVLSFLVKYPEFKSRIQTWVPIQTPFAGSPIADSVKEDEGLSFISKQLLEKLGGTQEALVSLTTEYSKSFFKKYSAEIKSIQKDVNIISFASYKNNVLNEWDTLLEPLRNNMLKKGLENDGLVPWQSAIYPESNYVLIEGVDHAVPVMYCTFIEFDRIRFLKTLLLMSL